MYAAKPCGGQESTLKVSNRSYGNTSRWMRGVSQRSKEGYTYASHSIARSSDRGGRPPVAGKPLHSHARDHQVNFERRRGHCPGFVDPECYRTVPFSSQYPPWQGITIWQAIVSVPARQRNQ